MAEHTLATQERLFAGLTVLAPDTWAPTPEHALSLTDALCDEIFAIWFQPASSWLIKMQILLSPEIHDHFLPPHSYLSYLRK